MSFIKDLHSVNRRNNKSSIPRTPQPFCEIKGKESFRHTCIVWTTDHIECPPSVNPWCPFSVKGLIRVIYTSPLFSSEITQGLKIRSGSGRFTTTNRFHLKFKNIIGGVYKFFDVFIKGLNKNFSKFLTVQNLTL